MEVTHKPTKKERFLKWWKVEGKIECTAAFVVLVVMLTFWDSLLVQLLVAISCGIWALGKIYFRRDQWAFLLMAALWVFSQAFSLLREYMNS